MIPDKLKKLRDEKADAEWLNPDGIDFKGITGDDFFAIYNKAFDDACDALLPVIVDLIRAAKQAKACLPDEIAMPVGILHDALVNAKEVLE